MTDSSINEQMENFANSNSKPKANNTFTYDKNRYFNVSLAPGENTRTIFIRLLPITPTANTPFIKVKAHNVPYKTRDGKFSTKPYICPTEGDESVDCPFCRRSKEAYAAEDAMKKQLSDMERSNGGVIDMATKSAIEKQIEQFHGIGVDNMVKHKFIVRLIERGKENEGVKFWMFDSSRKGDGYYDKIKKLYETERELRRNQNIFDLNTGCDIYIRIDRGSDGKKVLTFNAAQSSPLSTDDNQGYSWLNDTQTWDKMWTIKPIDYLEILANGGEPTFDREVGRYVDKSEMEARKNGQTFSEATRPYGQQPIQMAPQQQAQPQQPWQQQAPQQVWDVQQQPWQPQAPQGYAQPQQYYGNGQDPMVPILGKLSGQIIE